MISNSFELYINNSTQEELFPSCLVFTIDAKGRMKEVQWLWHTGLELVHHWKTLTAHSVVSALSSTSYLVLLKFLDRDETISVIFSILAIACTDSYTPRVSEQMCNTPVLYIRILNLELDWTTTVPQLPVKYTQLPVKYTQFPVKYTQFPMKYTRVPVKHTQ